MITLPLVLPIHSAIAEVSPPSAAAIWSVPVRMTTVILRRLTVTLLS
jgi:hypothetical protein